MPAPALPLLVIPLAMTPLEPEAVPLPEPVRAMIDAAIASGERKDVETVVSLAKATNPRSLAEIDAILAERFELVETVPGFGQAGTDLVLWRLKKEMPTWTPPAETAEE